MGTAQYCVKVNLPDGSLPSGVHIEAINKDAWFDSGRYWKGTTKDGVYCWENLDTGTNGDAYDFYLRYADSSGVDWRALFTDRISKKGVKELTLRQLFLDEDLEVSLPVDIQTFYSQTEEGKEILAAINELSSAIKNGMSHSALALSTYILEGMIFLKADENKIWKDEFGEKTFGGLLGVEEIRELFPKGSLDQVEGLNKFRRTGAHFKRVSHVIHEAKIGAHIIKELSIFWFRKALSKDSTDENVNTQ